MASHRSSFRMYSQFAITPSYSKQNTQRVFRNRLSNRTSQYTGPRPPGLSLHIRFGDQKSSYISWWWARSKFQFIFGVFPGIDPLIVGASVLDAKVALRKTQKFRHFHNQKHVTYVILCATAVTRRRTEKTIGYRYGACVHVCFAVRGFIFESRSSPAIMCVTETVATRRLLKRYKLSAKIETRDLIEKRTGTQPPRPSL